MKIFIKKLSTKLQSLSSAALAATLLLLIISLFFSFTGYKKPVKQSKSITADTIVQKTTFTCSSDPLPNGIVSEEDKIFSKLQKTLKVQILSAITSEEPSSVSGSGNIYCDITCEGYWKQTIPISPQLTINSSGTSNKIISSESVINLDEIVNRIEDAEKSMGSYSGNYTMKIRPDLQGGIEYKERKIPLDNSAELNFEYSNNQFKLISKEKEFSKYIPITDTQMITLEGSRILGITFPSILCKYLSPIAALISVIILILNRKSFQKSRVNDLALSNQIDKKYGSRFINLKTEPNFQNKLILDVTSFKELISLADDKELSILRYEAPSRSIIMYYVIDGNSIFSYGALKTETMVSNNAKNLNLGSDLLNG